MAHVTIDSGVGPDTIEEEEDWDGNVPLRLLKDVWAFRIPIIVIMTPILFSPLLFLGSPEATCAFVVILMSLYWLFEVCRYVVSLSIGKEMAIEVMPLAATALIPTFLFPLLGVLPSKAVCSAYIPDTNFLFIGGLIVAVAVERCGLHQRIALRVLTIVGAEPKWIMLGFMSVTAFLSMWISNTATTAMMVPIAQSVIEQLMQHKNSLHPDISEELKALRESHERGTLDSTHGSESEMYNMPTQTVKSAFLKLSTKQQSVAKGIMICIAFAANIGGTGTVTGSPPNLVTVGILEKTYQGADTGVNFGSWIQFAGPLMVINVILCWLTLVLYFLGPRELLCRCKKRSSTNGGLVSYMKESARRLPPISFAEISVLVCFGFLLLLWIFRDPKEIPGFAKLFKKDPVSGESYVSDATSAMLVAVLLFLLPSNLPDFFCAPGRDKRKDPQSRKALLDWSSMQEKFPWSVVLLLGGGFALAAGVKVSGLSTAISQLLQGLGSMPVVAVQFACVFITMGVSNICSNTVTASIFVPIVAGLAETLRVNPLELVLPVALSCSFAFCLPVATPPNAIVFASGVLTVPDMMKSGALITILSAGMTVLNHQTYARLILPLDEFPDWANSTMMVSGTDELL